MRWIKRFWVVVAMLAALHAGRPAFAREAALYVSGPAIHVAYADGGGSLFQIAPAFWGPDWGWTRVQGDFESHGDGSLAKIHGTFGNSGNVTFEGTIHLAADGPRKINVHGAFKVSADIDLTLACLAMNAGPSFHGAGRLTAVDGDGGETVHSVPPNNGGAAQFSQVKSLRIHNAEGEAIIVTYDIPLDLTSFGGFRWPLAEKRMKADEPRDWSFTVEFPFDIDAYFTADSVPMPRNIDRYFAWTASADTGPSVIDASSLLDAPAGRHGRVTREGDKLMYNGAPFKIWGTNTCYWQIAPAPEVADQRAAFYAKHGINAVRMHKFADGPTWDGLTTAASYVRYDEEKAQKMDYYIAALKERGIYTKLSANFGQMKIGVDDRGRVPYWAELAEPEANRDNRITTPHAAMWIAPEVQDLQIEQLCSLLRRENTATGIRYADDPAILLVEMVNENCAWFYSIWGVAMRVPLLKRMAGEQFRGWLHAKYGAEEALKAAWGANCYNIIPDQGTDDESWDGVIYPAGNPWYWDNVRDHRWPRLIDTALFWFDVSNAFYARFEAAIRETGYEGEIIASNWYAGSGMAQYLNLLSDARIGLIDRHNYHGQSWSMFHRPGSGIISTGLNTQMEDRPFMMSEWIHEAKPFMGDPAAPKPFDIASEGPFIYAAYGMGLNGWDGSFIFTNADDGKFKNAINDTWDVVLPNIIGSFPAISRMVLRGDVKESELKFARNLDMESLRKGQLGFSDRMEQAAYDVRAFSSDILPEQLMAVGRMVVRLNDEPVPTEAVNPEDYMVGGKLISSTGELAWRPDEHARGGFVTINTPFTQAIGGFGGGEKSDLADVAITTQNPYAVIYVTSLDNDKPIAEAGNLLITAIARIRNTDHRVIAGSSLDWGKGPILMEPVAAQIEIKRAGDFTVHVLDQDGRRAGEILPVDGRVIHFDTADSKTIYYEVEF